MSRRPAGASWFRRLRTIVPAIALGGLMPVLGGCKPAIRPVSCWRAENNPADSRGANDGVLKKGTGYDAGVKGRAFKFSAMGDAVSAPTQGLPTGTQERTLACWVCLNAIPGGGEGEAFFAGYGSFGKYGQTYHLGAFADRRLFFSQWGNAVIGPRLTTDEWHHLAVSNVDTHVVLYLDGAKVASGDLNFNTPPGTELQIGFIDAPLRTRQTAGLIDEIEVYDRALTPEQIRAIYRASSAGARHDAQPASPAKDGEQEEGTGK